MNSGNSFPWGAVAMPKFPGVPVGPAFGIRAMPATRRVSLGVGSKRLMGHEGHCAEQGLGASKLGRTSRCRGSCSRGHQLGWVPILGQRSSTRPRHLLGSSPRYPPTASTLRPSRSKTVPVEWMERQALEGDPIGSGWWQRRSARGIGRFRRHAQEQCPDRVRRSRHQIGDPVTVEVPGAVQRRAEHRPIERGGQRSRRPSR